MRTLDWTLLGLLTAMTAPACGSGDSADVRHPSPGGASGAASDDHDNAPGGEAGASQAGCAGEWCGPAGGLEQAPTAGSGGTPSGHRGQGGVQAATGQAGTAEAPGKPACHSNSDCAEGQACSEYGADERFHCGDASMSGSSLGQSCTSGVQCQDQICLAFSKQCTRLCEDDEDCADGDGLTCIQLGEDGFCQRQCASEAGCEETQHCSIALRRETQDYAWVCAIDTGDRPIGDQPAGGECTASSGCASGLCLAYGPQEHTSYACTGACESEDDCPGDSRLPACGQVTMVLAAGKTQALSACTPE